MFIVTGTSTSGLRRQVREKTKIKNSSNSDTADTYGKLTFEIYDKVCKGGIEKCPQSFIFITLAICSLHLFSVVSFYTLILVNCLTFPNRHMDLTHNCY